MAKDKNYIRGLFNLSDLDKEVKELKISDIPKYNIKRADELAAMKLFERFMRNDEIRYHSFIRAANVAVQYNDNETALQCLARANRLKAKGDF